MRVVFSFGALLIVLLEGCGARTGLSLPDAASIAIIDGGVPCIELPPDAGTIEIPLRTKAQLNRADVMFLIDNSASMQEEIERIQRRLSEVIAPAIQDQIVNAQFGVSTVSDFPVDPFGNPEDRPFELLSPMTSSLSRVQAAVDSVRLLNGRDEPEGQVEALYQLATGSGIGVYVPPSLGCPSGGAGYPCFRTDALPIVLLFTDDRMHNGPGEAEPYGFAISPRPHQYAEVVQALNRIGARVIGLDSGAGREGPAAAVPRTHVPLRGPPAGEG